MEIRSTYRTMMLWEEVTGKPFSLSTITDVVKYMYVCYETYATNHLTIDEFADKITDEDVERLKRQLGTTADNQEGGEKKK